LSWPPGSDTIGDIREKVPSLELDKVLEDSSLEKLTMQLGDTVDLEWTDNSKESHSDVFGVTLLNDRHSLDTGSIVRPSLSNLSEELEIDLVNNLQVSREELFEQADFPFFECLGKDSVASDQLLRCTGQRIGSLCVREDMSCDKPCLVPRNILLIEQDPHQLGDSQGRMCIVHLNTDVIGQSTPRLLELDEPPQDILQTSRSPEVLLLKSKQFTLVHVVVGVQDLGDVADFTGSVDTGLVVSGIERVEVKARDGSGFPKSDIGAVLGSVSGDRSIVSDGVTFHTSAPDSLVGIGDVLNLAVESDRVCNIISSDFPWLSLVTSWRLDMRNSRFLGRAMDQVLQAVLPS
jgi:hypothetical protein